MTGPAALAAPYDNSAGLLRERETRTPYFRMNATFAEVSETGKYESRRVQAGPSG
jgi:hypothetical protein